jgi:hypothetical protein
VVPGKLDDVIREVLGGTEGTKGLAGALGRAGRKAQHEYRHRGLVASPPLQAFGNMKGRGDRTES